MKSRCHGSASVQAVVLAAIVLLPAAARGDWHVVTVDYVGSANGGYPSLAIDSNGNSHVAYYDNVLRCLKYAKRVGDVWQTEIADPRVAGDPSLALDSLGRPHIAWRDCSSWTGAMYTYWDGAAWQSEVLGWGSFWSFVPTLVLNADDQPCMAWTRSGAGTTDSWDLNYATRTGSTWSLTNLAEGYNYFSRPGLVLDANGHPRIAWAGMWPGGTSARLRYYVSDGNGWSWEWVADTHCDTPLCLDANGDPHVLRADLDGALLQHGRRTATGWEFDDIIAGDWAGFPVMALDAFDHPHIAYWRWGACDLKYAHRTSSTWCVQTVDDSGSDDVGFTPSIAIDPDGDPHIAYTDRTNQTLEYAWWEPTVITGDLNCNGCVGFDDINPFVLYLANFETWQATYPNCLPANGDINGDGDYPSFRDINPFVELLAGS